MKSSISHLIQRLEARVKLILGLILTTIMFSAQLTYGQEYATSQTNSHEDESVTIVLTTITASASVTDPDNAVGAPDGDFATLSASGIKATSLITLDSRAILTLNLPTAVAAGKNSFVRIDAPTQTGINLDLGELINLLGLLENNTIIVTTSAGTAQKSFVTDPDGNLYIQVTSSSAYNSITITLDFGGSTSTLGSVLALGTLNLNVYHVVTYENAGFTPCEAMAFSYAGIDPDLNITSGSILPSVFQATLNDAIQDPEKAIDGIVNNSNFSILQNGNIGAASSVSQSFFLGKTSPGTNQVVATLSAPGLLADINVLSGIFIQAYDGPTAIGSPQPISSFLIGITLLDFQSNPRTITFVPGTAFNRIVITSTGIADVFSGLRIHEIGSRPPISFTGGRVVGGTAGEAINSSIILATANSSPFLPGFSIACGTASEHSYSLFEVDQSGARTLGGTLPPSFSLGSNGGLTGNPELDEDGTYLFDVQATNVFQQTAVASFIITIETNLPVSLVNFDAVSEGSTAALTWSTSMETNSDRFEIERSQTGKNWSKIGTVSSNHESTSMNYYSFVDNKPFSGQNLYRLKMIDLDETFSYSHIQNVNFTTTSFLYPNPVNGVENLQVNMIDWTKIKSLRVISATGKTILETSNALSSGINTKNLPAGFYFVKMVHTDGTISTHKFVRQ